MNLFDYQFEWKLKLVSIIKFNIQYKIFIWIWTFCPTYLLTVMMQFNFILLMPLKNLQDRNWMLQNFAHLYNCFEAFLTKTCISTLWLGSFTNYIEQFLDIFYHHRQSLLTYSMLNKVDKNWPFWTTYSPLLVHLICERAPKSNK